MISKQLLFFKSNFCFSHEKHNYKKKILKKKQIYATNTMYLCFWLAYKYNTEEVIYVTTDGVHNFPKNNNMSIKTSSNTTVIYFVQIRGRWFLRYQSYIENPIENMKISQLYSIVMKEMRA